MSPFTKDDVVQKAFKLYKKGETMEKSIWRLAELCCIINKNVKNGYDIKPLETDNLVLLIRENVNGELLKPPENEIKEAIRYAKDCPELSVEKFMEELVCQ